MNELYLTDDQLYLLKQLVGDACDSQEDIISSMNAGNIGGLVYREESDYLAQLDSLRNTIIYG